MVQKNKYSTGDILTTPNYGNVEIIEYVNNKNVTVKFLNTGYIATSQQLGNIVNGNLKDKFAPSVYNVGITGEEICSIEGKELKSFKFRPVGSMATIGRNEAVVSMGSYKSSGFTAWMI